MKTSDQINELAAALAKAQSAMGQAPLDKVNPHFRSKYASLASIIETAKKPMTAQNLSFVQGVEYADQRVIVTTRLMHASGQWMESCVSLKPQQDSAQAMGSAVTYGRRYGLQSMLGLVGDEDDDGNAAEQKPSSAPPPPKAAAPASKKPAPEVKPTVEDFDLGAWIMPSGVHKGRALKDIEPAALKATLSWLDTQAASNNLGNAMLDVRANLKRWFEINSENQTGDGHPF
jgi:hypothetical protein